MSNDSNSINVGMVGLSATGMALGLKLASRGSRLRKLESLVPKVSTDNIDTFKSKLKPGDVLLIGKTGLKGIDALGEKFTKLSEGFNVHTAMYVGNNEIVHVTHNRGGGILKDSLDMHLKPNRNILVVRPNEPQEKIDLSVKLAKSAFKEKRYKYGKNIATLSAKGLMGDTEVEKKLSKMLFKDRVNNSTVLCSTAVADIQSRAGFKQDLAPRVMTTVDFRSMYKPPVLEFKGLENTYKTSKYQGMGFFIPSFALGTYELKKEI